MGQAAGYHVCDNDSLWLTLACSVASQTDQRRDCAGLGLGKQSMIENKHGAAV